jgi:hypothetical protein
LQRSTSNNTFEKLSPNGTMHHNQSEPANMKNRSDHYDRLMRAAQKLPENDQTPYGFEKRIMAHIASCGHTDGITLWTLGLWKAALPCVAIMLLTTTWASLANPNENSRPDDSLATELQLTMTQPLEALEESW